METRKKFAYFCHKVWCSHFSHEPAGENRLPCHHRCSVLQRISIAIAADSHIANAALVKIDSNLSVAASCYMFKITYHSIFLDHARRDRNFSPKESELTFGDRFLIPILLPRIRGINNRNRPITTYN